MASDNLLSDIPPALLDELPALLPPPGVQPNFANPEDHGPALAAVATVLAFFTLVSYGVRMYTKVFIVRRTTWDDCEAEESFLCERSADWKHQ